MLLACAVHNRIVRYLCRVGAMSVLHTRERRMTYAIPWMEPHAVCRHSQAAPAMPTASPYRGLLMVERKPRRDSALWSASSRSSLAPTI